MKIPQTPYMKNLDKIDVMSKAESNFLKVIVRPLWYLMNTFLNGEIDEALKMIDENIIEWEKNSNSSPQIQKKYPLIKESIILTVHPCDEVVENKKNLEQGTQSASLNVGLGSHGNDIFNKKNEFNKEKDNGFLKPMTISQEKIELNILSKQTSRRKSFKKVDFSLLPKSEE